MKQTIKLECAVNVAHKGSSVDKEDEYNSILMSLRSSMFPWCLLLIKVAL